jgi:hypothetical protein
MKRKKNLKILSAIDPPRLKPEKGKILCCKSPVALPSFILGFRRSSFNNTGVKR